MESPLAHHDEEAQLSATRDSGDDTSATQPRQEERSRRSDVQKDDPSLEYAVKHFLPDAEGEELHQRKRLLKAREMGARKMATSDSPPARMWASEAHHIAATFAYDPHQSPERLQIAADTCHGLMKAVLCADSLNLGGDPI